MRAVVFEPDHGGHRLTYVAHLAQGLVTLGIECSIHLDEGAAGTAEYATQIAPLPAAAAIRLLPGHPRGGATSAALRKLAMLHRSLQEMRPDHLFVPYADGLTQVLSLVPGAARRLHRGGMQTEALMMRGPYPAMPPMRFYASRHALQHAPWTRLHHSDGRLCADERHRDRLNLMPEPIETAVPRTRAQARAELGLAPGTAYVLLAGYLDERKCIAEIVRAFADEFRPGEPVGLLLAGRMAPSTRAQVGDLLTELENAGRVAWLDRYVSDAELALVIQAADVVCTIYRGHEGPASIANRAMCAHRWVLAGPGAWFDWAIRRLGLGQVCDSLAQAELRAALRGSIADAARFAPGAVSRRLATFHTIANFRATWLEAIASSLGRPPLDRVPWRVVEEAAAAAGLPAHLATR